MYIHVHMYCIIAIRLAVKHSLPGPLDDWRAERDSIQEEVMERGWNHELGSFVQSYNSTELDASNLIMPLVFFIAPNDRRFISTLKKTCKALSSGGLTVNNLTFRYNPYSLEADKELLGNDGTFCMCSFWLAEALCLAGKYDEECLKRAISMFEDMIGYANHLGLFSEEISLSGRSVGNFPQALTHLSLISAAFNINRVLESINKF
jgi:GH15 family glucan-1,4-alpha-glucosidase